MTHIDPVSPPEMPPFQPDGPEISPPSTPEPDIPPVGPDHPDMPQRDTPNPDIDPARTPDEAPPPPDPAGS